MQLRPFQLFNRSSACLLLLFFLVQSISPAYAQIKSNQKQSGWFNDILTAWSTASEEEWKKNHNKTWDKLRLDYRDAESLTQMSWEERDKIWWVPKNGNVYQQLANKYKQAYMVSCQERGIKPEAFNTNISDAAGLQKLRNLYLNSRKAEYVILTPKAGKEPQINGAAVYGVRPGNELIYRLPVTGERPMKFTVKGLPKGVSFDSRLGVMNGKVDKPGNYTLTITAQNKHGKAQQDLVLKVGNQIALTPPMGWNSWNSFACDVTEKDIRNTLDRMVNSGLANYGWSYINIDDCWMKKPIVTAMTGKDKEIRETFYNRRTPARQRSKKIRFNEPEMEGATRDAQGAILSNKDFPDMKALTDYIHQQGLKAGLYTSPGPLTCQLYEGSYGHEQADAQQFANWGFDYLKYDWCGYSGISQKPTVEDSQLPYRIMGQALQNVNRDILYSLCQYGRNDVWKWGEEMGGNAWRTTGDIRDNWDNMMGIADKQAGLEGYAGPGHWNDPDMLVVGYVGWSKNLRPTYLSPNEQYTHISLWSLLSAPLLIGCDLTKMDDFTFGLLSNPEVIAVNQDVLGKQASRVVNTENIQVWVKDLADGSKAVGIFNVGEESMKYNLNLADLKLPAGKARDLWTQQDLGEFKTSIPVTVNRHGVKLLKLTGDKMMGMK